ncbi:MAG: proline dehydrogenase family protein [Saprospiraceae bacterium]
MKAEGKPVNPKRDALTKALKEQLGIGNHIDIDFQDTAIAFADKTDEELKKTAWLFGMMNKHWLVGIGAKIGMTAIKMHLPFVESVVKGTIFRQFCGGTTLLESTENIERLYESNIVSILDYGAEGKTSEEDYNLTMNENIRAIEFASNHESAWMISTKISGLARFELLEKVSANLSLSVAEQEEWLSVEKRINAVCFNARQFNVGVMIDAEESWVQPAIDQLTQEMMLRYNQEKVIVYNTFQMYRKDRLAFLKDSFIHSQQNGYILGAKLVRGAYMEKERKRAEEMGYDSPINEDKLSTDQCFNEGLQFCIEHYEKIAFCNATHNEKSCMLMAQLIAQKGIDKKHPHLLFAQLYGMSDNLTYNLANYGFRAAKYMVYGSVREVVPYLIRRAEENSSVTGDMTREHKFVVEELKRRGLN